jgi:hypothetical protein
MRGLEVNAIVAAWHVFFDGQYSMGVTHFYDLAVFSFQWFDNTFAFPTTTANVIPAIVMSSP